MIHLQHLTKYFDTRGVRQMIVDDVSMTLPPGKAVGLLGRNGAGKSTLLKMIAGTVDPTDGRVLHSGSVSWPVGFAGSFHPDLTGLQNIRFIARIYGVDTDGLTEFVEDFSELGEHFYLPCRGYSSGMRSRLAFGASMGIHFDTYLVDEVTSVGDAAFRLKSEAVFQERICRSGALLVSHGTAMLKRNCSAGLLLEHGKLTWFDDITEAIEVHEYNIKARALDDSE